MKASAKILTGSVTIMVVAQLLYMLADKGLRLFYNHEYPRQQEILLNKTSYDILFIGSSRMHSGINPFVVDSVTGLNTFNAANDGGKIYEIKATLDAYLVNHPAPKMVVVNIDYTSFSTQRKYFNPTIYYPFLNNAHTYYALNNAGEHTALYKWLPFTRFTAYDDYTRSNILKGFAGKSEVVKGQLSYKGFLSTAVTEFKQPAKNIQETVEADSLGLELLNAIVDTCIARNIKMMFVYAPDYRLYGRTSVLNFAATMREIETLAEKNNIPFHYYDNLPMCNNSKYFTDVRHVNKYGSVKYSEAVANDIRQLLNINR